MSLGYTVIEGYKRPVWTSLFAVFCFKIWKTKTAVFVKDWSWYSFFLVLDWSWDWTFKHYSLLPFASAAQSPFRFGPCQIGSQTSKIGGHIRPPAQIWSRILPSFPLHFLPHWSLRSPMTWPSNWSSSKIYPCFLISNLLLCKLFSFLEGIIKLCHWYDPPRFFFELAIDFHLCRPCLISQKTCRLPILGKFIPPSVWYSQPPNMKNAPQNGAFFMFSAYSIPPPAFKHLHPPFLVWHFPPFPLHPFLALPFSFFFFLFRYFLFR